MKNIEIKIDGKLAAIEYPPEHILGYLTALTRRGAHWTLRNGTTLEIREVHP